MNRTDSENTLTDIYCTEPEVEVKLKELKPDNAAGSDGFLLNVIKNVVDGFVPHLCQIFNRSLTTPKVPLDLSSADVFIIPKKVSSLIRSITDPSDRPPSQDKSLRPSNKARMVNFLETNYFINTSQHDFR